jgi:D-apionolactonase
MNGYFGTNEPLPELVELKAGKLTTAYEQGSLRYIRVGEEELIRRIYPALRDQDWNTIPYTIENVKITSLPSSFKIAYSASFQQNQIQYHADFEIRGSDMGQISFTMWGEAQSSFLRNRIGLCVLHPIQECIGQYVEATSPEGNIQQGTFPTLISPDQPFVDISQLYWSTGRGVEAQLFLEGEVFEMEDQRNWADYSFKTYGTPLRLPKPVRIERGDTLCQRVVVRLKSIPMKPLTSKEAGNFLIESGETAPFPRIGYSLSDQPLDGGLVEKLREIPCEFLRVLLKVESESWEFEFKDALNQVRLVPARLELVVVLGKHPWQEVADLIGVLTGNLDQINSLALINEPREVSVDGFFTVAQVLKKYLPTLLIGYATDGFFADLNRLRPEVSHYDFVAFSLNPQVHATDIRTIVENVSAQQYPIQTIRSFGERRLGIHVSPLTLRIRNQGNSYDSRLHTEFGAAFTLLSLRYMAGVDQVTLYETHGPGGVVSVDTATISPVFDYLRHIREFGPDQIFLSQSPEPFAWDALVLGNTRGDKCYFLVNFSAGPKLVHLAALGREVVLPAESITIHYDANS